MEMGKDAFPESDRLLTSGPAQLKVSLIFQFHLYILQIKAYGFQGESGSLNLFLGIKIH